MLPEPLAVTLKVTQILEKLEVPYLVGGSLASTLYGMVRTTQDSDIVAEMHLEHVKPFILALQDEFFIDDEMMVESIQRYSSFNIIHRETMFKVDVFVPRPRPFVQAQMSRVQRQVFSQEDDLGANFASPEDTILAKLEWYRMGDEVSDRQWRDILGVIKTRAGNLDLDYLYEWAMKLKVGDLLARALQNR